MIGQSVRVRAEITSSGDQRRIVLSLGDGVAELVLGPVDHHGSMSGDAYAYGSLAALDPKSGATFVDALARELGVTSAAPADARGASGRYRLHLIGGRRNAPLAGGTLSPEGWGTRNMAVLFSSDDASVVFHLTREALDMFAIALRDGWPLPRPSCRHAAELASDTPLVAELHRLDGVGHAVPPEWAGERPFAIVGTRTTPVLATWSAPGQPATAIVALDSNVMDLKVSPDGSRAVAMTRRVRSDGTLVAERDLLVVDGNRVRRLPLPSEPSTYFAASLLWSPAGDELAVSYEGRVTIVDAATLAPTGAVLPADASLETWATDGIVLRDWVGDGWQSRCWDPRSGRVSDLDTDRWLTAGRFTVRSRDGALEVRASPESIPRRFPPSRGELGPRIPPNDELAGRIRGELVELWLSHTEDVVVLDLSSLQCRYLTRPLAVGEALWSLSPSGTAVFVRDDAGWLWGRCTTTS